MGIDLVYLQQIIICLASNACQVLFPSTCLTGRRVGVGDGRRSRKVYDVLRGIIAVRAHRHAEHKSWRQHLPLRSPSLNHLPGFQPSHSLPIGRTGIAERAKWQATAPHTDHLITWSVLDYSKLMPTACFATDEGVSNETLVLENACRLHDANRPVAMRSIWI